MTASIPRYKDGRPWVVPVGGAKTKRFTRTSKFANTMDDSYGLDLHHQHMVAIGLDRNRWVFGAVNAAYDQGEERGYDWDKMNAACAKAMDLAGANDKSEWGTYMHGLTELLDTGQPLPDQLRPKALADLMAYEQKTENLKFDEVERFCVNDDFEVAGTPDRRAYVKDAVLPTGEIFTGWVIADLKTGKLDGSDVKFSVQLATYARSKWYWCTHGVLGEPTREQCDAQARSHIRKHIDVSLDWGIIIDLPRHAGTCELRWIDLRKGWELAQLCKTVREERRAKTYAPLFFA